MAVVELPSPEVPEPMRARAARWAELKRWERRELAQDLRRLGLSYAEIAAVIFTSKETLSAWCRDVTLDPELALRLAKKRPRLAAMQANGARIRQEALARHEAIRTAARAEAEHLQANPLWVAGTVAYWAEGGKTTNELRFANSDPATARRSCTTEPSLSEPPRVVLPSIGSWDG